MDTQKGLEVRELSRLGSSRRVGDLAVEEYLGMVSESLSANDIVPILTEDSQDASNYWFTCHSTFISQHRAAPELDSVVARYTRIMESLAQENTGPLYRGMTTEGFGSAVDHDNYLSQRFQVGQIIDEGFISTSLSPVVSYVFAKGFKSLPSIQSGRLKHFSRHVAPHNSGMMMEFSGGRGFASTMGWDELGDGEYSKNYEYEVVLLPQQWCVVEVIPRRLSLTGLPTVRLSCC